MKKLILVLVILAAISVAQAETTISFAGTTYGTGTAEYGATVTYTAGGLISFTDTDITTGLDLLSDELALNGAWIELPDLQVSMSTIADLGYGIYTADLLATGNKTVTIQDLSGVRLTGTLGAGTLTKTGTSMLIYAATLSELTIDTLNDTTPTSAAMAKIIAQHANGMDTLDFDLSLTGLGALDLGMPTGSTIGNYSGSITAIPVVCLGAISDTV